MLAHPISRLEHKLKVNKQIIFTKYSRAQMKAILIIKTKNLEYICLSNIFHS